MSLVAQVWVNGLPLDIGLNYAAYRVLGKLADAHHAESGQAYRHVDRLAGELRCSKRTVQRALKDLQLLGLIHRGDQRLVSHLDVRYRPTVWTLALEAYLITDEPLELEGVTTGVTPDGPVDNSGSGVTTGVTPPDPGVTDTPRSGVTTAVAQRTGSRTTRTSTSATTARASSKPVDNEHRFAPEGRFCLDCGISRDGRHRIEWATQIVRPATVRRSA